MKTILALAVLTLSFTACNNSGTAKTQGDTDQEKVEKAPTEARSKAEPSSSVPITAVETEKTDKIDIPFSTKEIVSRYLLLKNALAKDDSKAAANAGKSLFEAFSTINPNTLEQKKKSFYLDIAESAKENAEHIGDNSGKIDHQREHFALLSRDISDLIKTFGRNGQKLYQDFCPMYNDGKGADWISETKEIKNPYFGKVMSACGSVKKEY
jgi:hypothetical protein